MRRIPCKNLSVGYHLNTGLVQRVRIEIIAALSPRTTRRGLGVKLVGSPKLADILLVTGL